MEIEKKIITLLDNKVNQIVAELILYEEAPENEDMVLLEIVFGEKKFISEERDFFSALVSLRKELEQENLQIACNGAAKNVYPSPMQQTMGYGRKAYKLQVGYQATNENIVDIFGCDNDLDFVSLEEQSNFYTLWIKSVMG
jgi:hypothetical protein